MRRALVCLTLTIFGCAHIPSHDAGTGFVDSGTYARLVEANTEKVNRYSGFYQTFQADVTMLSTYVQSAQLQQESRFLDWDAKTYQDHHDKMLQDAGAYARFFMRFYAPDSDYDDFSHGKSIWRIYLDYNGQRFEGQVKAVDKKLVELKTLYPNFDRFSSGYTITFNVPMTTIQDRQCKVIMTSSLGSAEFVFPKKK